MSANPNTAETEVEPAADPRNLDRLERWAAQVVADSARLDPGLSEEELAQHQAAWYAEYFVTSDGWLVASPDDPAMRAWLLDEEGLTPELADAVLAEMARLAAGR
jgi:hypothetical protein